MLPIEGGASVCGWFNRRSTRWPRIARSRSKSTTKHWLQRSHQDTLSLHPKLAHWASLCASQSRPPVKLEEQKKKDHKWSLHFNIWMPLTFISTTLQQGHTILQYLLPKHQTIFTLNPCRWYKANEASFTYKRPQKSLGYTRPFSVNFKTIHSPFIWDGVTAETRLTQE